MASAAGGIGAGEQRGSRGLSVSFRKVRGMSERRFRRTPGGVSELGLQVVWRPKYRELTVRRYIEHQWDAVA